jgi:hypothetical protein
VSEGDGTWGMIWRVIGVVGEGAVPSCCCAVLCRGLALGLFGGNRGIWTSVGARVGRVLGAVGEIVVVFTLGGGEPRWLGDTLGESGSSQCGLPYLWDASVNTPERSFNRITATGAYMRHRFSRASFKLNNFLNFCPFATFDSSNCS